VGWGFVWLMFVLKIPIVMLLGIVWWAVKAEPEIDHEPRDDGGSKRRPHPHPPFPRSPRRGPHGDSMPPAPPRTRAVVARARSLDG
jgi:hypothetical protein